MLYLKASLAGLVVFIVIQIVALWKLFTPIDPQRATGVWDDPPGVIILKNEKRPKQKLRP